MVEPTSDGPSAIDLKELEPPGTGLRVSVWTEANGTGGWDLVLTCRNRDVPDRRLSFATERLAEEALEPCSMRFMEDIKWSEGDPTASPPLT